MNRKPIPKLHLFRWGGRNIVFDCHTFATFMVDDLAYHVLQLYEQTQGNRQAIREMLCERYAEREMQNILQEIEALQADGYLVGNDSPLVWLQVEPADADQLKSNNMTLMVAQTCNLRCAYCFTDVGSFAAYPCLMDVDTAKQAIDFLVERSGGNGLCRVAFLGGEPLLKFDLIREVVAYCDTLKKSNLDFKFNVTTNGILLSDDVLEFLDEHRFGVLLSFDGPREIHDAYRCFPDGRGSFDSVMEAARKIKSRGRPLWVQATLTHQSPPLEQLLEFFERNVGAERVLADPVVDVADAKPFSMTEDDLDNLLAQIEREFVRSLPRLVNGKTIPYSPLLGPLRQLHHRRGAILNCYAGKGQIAVASNGDIYPCCRFVGLEAFVIGNVWDGLDGERWASFFNTFYDASQKCKSCWAYYQCIGGCARERALDNGTFRSPDDMVCRQLLKWFELVIATYAFLRRDYPGVMDWIAGSTALQGDSGGFEK